jgi:hypothetical protein
MHQLFAPAFGSWQSNSTAIRRPTRGTTAIGRRTKCCTICCSIYIAMQHKASLLDLAHFKLNPNNVNGLKGIRLSDEMAMLQFMLQQMLQHNDRRPP